MTYFYNSTCAAALTWHSWNISAPVLLATGSKVNTPCYIILMQISIFLHTRAIPLSYLWVPTWMRIAQCSSWSGEIMNEQEQGQYILRRLIRQRILQYRARLFSYRSASFHFANFESSVLRLELSSLDQSSMNLLRVSIVCCFFPEFH